MCFASQHRYVLGAKRVSNPECKRVNPILCMIGISGEPVVTRKWMEYMSGDQIRMLARSFGVPGDHPGQETRGYRFPCVLLFALPPATCHAFSCART